MKCSTSLEFSLKAAPKLSQSQNLTKSLGFCLFNMNNSGRGWKCISWSSNQMCKTQPQSSGFCAVCFPPRKIKGSVEKVWIVAALGFHPGSRGAGTGCSVGPQTSFAVSRIRGRCSPRNAAGVGGGLFLSLRLSLSFPAGWNFAWFGFFLHINPPSRRC